MTALKTRQANWKVRLQFIGKYSQDSRRLGEFRSGLNVIAYPIPTIHASISHYLRHLQLGHKCSQNTDSNLLSFTIRRADATHYTCRCRALCSLDARLVRVSATGNSTVDNESPADAYLALGINCAVYAEANSINQKLELCRREGIKSRATFLASCRPCFTGINHIGGSLFLS